MQTRAGRIVRTVAQGVFAATLLAAGCDCPKTGEVADCPVNTPGSTRIALTPGQQGPGGVLLYTGSTSPLPSMCVNRLDSFMVEGAAVPVRFAEDNDPGKCASSSVVLGPAPTSPVTSSAADVMKVFNEMHPKLPVSFIACVDAGGSPPVAIGVIVSYTTASS